jgi:hypothetical protein
MTDSETDTTGDPTAPDDDHEDHEGHEGHEGHGTRQPGADPEDAEEIEEERQERLDPDNRPEDAQVDNTDREFDAKKGMFTDAEGYDAAEEKYPAIGEQEA